MVTKLKVGFIGLGKLGLPISEAISEKHSVFGFDSEERKSKKIKILTSVQEVVEASELIFVAVPTPHDSRYDGSLPVQNLPTKDFDYTSLLQTLKQIHQYVKATQTVVVISTVLPGTLRQHADIFFNACPLIYNPYLIAMGTEVKDFLNPEMVIVGTKLGKIDSHVERLLNLYKSMLNPNAKYVCGSWEEAESIKIFYNTFISVKLSLVNMIQDVAMNLGHMNVDTVTQALANSDQRIISKAYMQAGLGDGGPCHPRDNIALRSLSQRLNLGYDLFGAISDSREKQAKNMANYLSSKAKAFVILGQNYKPGIHLTDGSYILLVAHFLKVANCDVWFVDPKTNTNQLPEQKILQQHHEQNNLIYVVNYWEPWIFEFNFLSNPIVFDPWRSSESLKIKDATILSYGNTLNA